MARKDKRYQKPYKKGNADDSQLENEAASDEQAEEAVVTADSTPPQKTNYLPYLAMFILGFLLYVNTVPFEYVLDDKLYVTGNEYTKKGFDGIAEHWTNDLMTGFFGSKRNLVEGGRYRPLPLTTHAIEWQFFGNNPHVSHFINVIMYGLIGVIMLMVMQLLFTEQRDRWWWNLPILVTALFLAHPLHTEVGANIKSRDELMSMIFALMTMRSVLLYARDLNIKQLILSGVWFWLCLACRESSLVFLGVIPLALIFFGKANLKQGILALIPMVVALGAYLLIRMQVYADFGNSMEVADELMNKPYMLATDSERYASIFFTLGIYIKLLFFPHPLTHDYYPFHPFRTFEELSSGSSQYADWSEPMSIIAVLIYLAMAVYGVITLVQRFKGKAPSIPGFGVLLYLGTFILFSNLLFDIGSFMNERWMFTPSIGFCIVIAWLIDEKLAKKGQFNVATGVMAVLVVAYSVKTIDRNYAWESDHSLAMTDIGTSGGSAKVKMTAGSEKLEDAKDATNPTLKARLLNEAEQHCLNSLKIYPGYFPPLDILGNIYFEKGNYEYSTHYFKQAVKRKPQEMRLLTNLEAVGNRAASEKQFEVAIDALKLVGTYYQGSDRARVFSKIGEVYGKDMGQPEEALKYLRKARKADPTSVDPLQKMGIIKAMTNQADSALIIFREALQIEPENARVMLNYGILQRQLGNEPEGSQMIQRAMEIDPSLNTGG